MTSIMDPNWGVFANRPPSPFGGNLTDDGTLTGNKNMANDYSVTPQEFWFEVPSGFNFDMHAVFVRYCMSAVPRKEDYADIDGGLDNGLLFTATRNGVTTALGPPITNNAEWAFAATGNSHANFEPGVLEDVWTFSIDIEQVFGTHDRFYGAQNDRYSCTVSDDLSDIYCHEIYVYGTVTKYVL